MVEQLLASVLGGLAAAAGTPAGTPPAQAMQVAATAADAGGIRSFFEAEFVDTAALEAAAAASPATLMTELLHQGCYDLPPNAETAEVMASTPAAAAWTTASIAAAAAAAESRDYVPSSVQDAYEHIKAVVTAFDCDGLQRLLAAVSDSAAPHASAAGRIVITGTGTAGDSTMAAAGGGCNSSSSSRASTRFGRREVLDWVDREFRGRRLLHCAVTSAVDWHPVACYAAGTRSNPLPTVVPLKRRLQFVDKLLELCPEMLGRGNERGALALNTAAHYACDDEAALFTALLRRSTYEQLVHLSAGGWAAYHTLANRNYADALHEFMDALVEKHGEACRAGREHRPLAGRGGVLFTWRLHDDGADTYYWSGRSQQLLLDVCASHGIFNLQDKA